MRSEARPSTKGIFSRWNTLVRRGHNWKRSATGNLHVATVLGPLVPFSHRRRARVLVCVGVRWCDGLRLYECIIASCKCEQLKMCFRQKLSFYLCEIKANRQTYLRFVCAWNVNVCQGLRIRYRAASSSPLSAALRHFSILIYFTLFLFSRTFLLCRAGDQEKLLAESRKNIWNFDGNIKLATSLTFHLTVIDAPLFLGGNTLHAPLFPSSLHDLHAIRLL